MTDRCILGDFLTEPPATPQQEQAYVDEFLVRDPTTALTARQASATKLDALCRKARILRCSGIAALRAFLLALCGLGFWSVSTVSVATEPPVAKWPVRGIFVVRRWGSPWLWGKSEVQLSAAARKTA